MRPVFYIPIGGTRSWNDRNAPKRRWWQKGSDFAAKMRSLNCIMLDEDQPFVWTTDLNGIQFWRRWPIWFGKIDRKADHRDWICGGENLIRYADSIRGPIPFEDRNVITHSWGFAPLIYAACFGLRIRRLIAVSPPFRYDLEDVVREARKNIEFFVLVVDPNADRVANWGAFGDGHFGSDRFFDSAGLRPDIRVGIPGHNHSGILTDMLDRWDDLSNYLR
jgi:hypothetical protein